MPPLHGYSDCSVCPDLCSLTSRIRIFRALEARRRLATVCNGMFEHLGGQNTKKPFKK